MSIDPRIERNTRSVFALRAYLREIIQNPSTFAANDTLIKALKSQGALSKLNDNERGICATSINTVKRISNVLEGGFDTLDRLRTSALKAIDDYKKKERQSNKTTKSGLEDQLKDKDKDLLRTFQDLWHVTQALKKSMTQARYYARRANNPAVLALCEREQRELLASLSLCKDPMVTKGMRHDDERT